MVSTVAAQTSDDLFAPHVLNDVQLQVNTRDLAALREHWIENTYYPADMTWRGQRIRNVAIRSRGTGSRNPVSFGLIGYHFVKNPTVDPFYMDWRFSTYVLNNMFQWNKTEAGVLLYNGVEEMALASVYDIYSDSGTSKVHSITSTDAAVVTKHGLNLISRYAMSDAPKLDKMIVPGTKARTLASEELNQWNEGENTKELHFVHSDSPDRFIFEVQLEDLAKQEDILTAKHAVKRLEYRAADIHLEGNPVPYETYFNLLLTMIVSLVVAGYIDRRLILKRKTSKVVNA